jgi:hypothetical protein
MSTSSNLLAIGLLVLASVVAVQSVLATRRYLAYGLIMPAAFLLLAGTHLYRSMYVHNPHPTMAEGFMVAFGVAGFVVSAVVLISCRIVRRRGRD